MTVRASIASLLTGVFIATCITSAMASTREAAAIHTLATSNNSVALKQACRTLQPALWVTVPIGSEVKTNTRGDEAFHAYVQFLTSQRNEQARISCLGTLQSLSVTGIDTRTGTNGASPYATEASHLLQQILRGDPSPAMRVAAAKSMWGSMLPEDGIALLQSAEHDSSPEVRAASLRSMFWPARADIARSHDSASYDAAIDAALQSSDPQIVGGALIALASFHGLAADATIRPYAFDSRSVVRTSAIDAYDYMGAYNASVACFIEARLSDPDRDVRSSAMLRLFRMGDHAALPAIRKIARDAPTQDERKEAAEYVRAFVTQPDFPHASCSTP